LTGPPWGSPATSVAANWASIAGLEVVRLVNEPTAAALAYGLDMEKAHMAVEEDREPVVDVLEEGNMIRVIAELPGVAQGDIAYQVNGDVLTISTKGDHVYHAEVLLPGCVEKEGIQSSYNNGVLELRLRKM
jgi:HSP20 family molecular chaperone IbpA